MHTFKRYEEMREIVKMENEQIELQKDVGNNECKVTESFDQVIIKSENEDVSISTENEHVFTKPWIKCEVVEELRLENTHGFTELTEKYMIKNEDDHILKCCEAEGIHKLNTCSQCNVTFRGKSSLDDHIVRKHPDVIAGVSSKIHECRYCVKSNLGKHMVKHPEVESGCVCIHCNTTFTRKTNLDDHIIKKHPEYIASVSSKIFECKYCVFKTALKISLVRHMGKHPGAERGRELKTCIHCDAMFTERISLDNHIIKKHPEYIASLTSKLYECKYCAFKTTSSSYLSKHMVNHPGAESGCKLKTCIYCKTTFKCKIGLDDHIIQKHPAYIASVSSKIHECKYCAFKTALKISLVRHMGRHPGAEGGRELKTCIHCNAMFKERISLDNHIMKKHPEYTASIASKIYECKYCVYKTTLKSHLTSHMGKHSGPEAGSERKPCIHCAATFKHKKTLNNHIVEKHPEHIASVSSKILECKYCRFKTALKSYLVSHMEKHSGAEPGCELKTCIHCNATFKYKINLEDHIVKNHPGYITSVSRKVHECIYCTYKTTLKSKFTKHMLKHPADNSCKHSEKS